MIYLDHAATTKIDKQVLDVFTSASEQFFGNESSLHDVGTKASEALKEARTVLANSLHAEFEEVFFTSGGTESNQLAIMTLLNSVKKEGNHLITTEIEHSSIFNLFKKLEGLGYEVTYLKTDKQGLVSLEEIRKNIRKDTILASIQHVNSEIGVKQNLKEIGKLLYKENIYFHSDLVQSYGKMALDVNDLNLTSGSISSHKIHGPKGIGLVFLSKDVHYKVNYPGTTHENGFRPGTVDVPSALAFAYAGQKVTDDLEKEQISAKNLRQLLKQRLESYKNQIIIHSHPTNQVDQIIGLSLQGLQGQYVMLECNRYDIAISTGSACQIGQTLPSRMMLAMGKTDIEAKELIRVSMGRHTTEREINHLADVLIKTSDKRYQ